MKNRTVIAILSLFMTVSLTGCGSSSKEDADKTQKETETEQTAAETEETETAEAPKEISSRDQIYKVGDTVVTDKYEFTLTAAEYADAFSIQPDDSFLQTADTETPPQDYQWLIYNVEYRYIASYSSDDLGMFAADEYSVGQNHYGSEFVCAYRKEGDSWIVSQYTPFFAGLSAIVNSYSPAAYTYEPSAQMYQARGALKVMKEDITDEPLMIRLERYQFEIHP